MVSAKKNPSSVKKRQVSEKISGDSLKSSAEIAEIFGLTERHVRRMAKDGDLPCVSSNPYKFRLEDTAKVYIQSLNDRLKPLDMETALKEKARADADYRKAKAQIADLELAELKGEMHRSEDVEAMTSDLVYTIRSMVMSLPGRLAMDVVKCNTPAEASALIDRECMGILEQLSGYKYDPAEYAKRVRQREGWRKEEEEADDE